MDFETGKEAHASKVVEGMDRWEKWPDRSERRDPDLTNKVALARCSNSLAFIGFVNRGSRDGYLVDENLNKISETIHQDIPMLAGHKDGQEIFKVRDQSGEYHMYADGTEVYSNRYIQIYQVFDSEGRTLACIEPGKLSVINMDGEVIDHNTGQVLTSPEDIENAKLERNDPFCIAQQTETREKTDAANMYFTHLVPKEEIDWL